MEGTITISQIMLRDHQKIGTLLANLNNGMNKDHQKVLELFHEFIWTLEKHFFIEERIVLTDYNPPDEKNSAAISNLLREHDHMLKLSRKLEEDLIKNKKVDISQLQKMLIKHRDYENEVLYPMLDLELNKTQKKTIVQKVTDYYKW